MPRNVSTNTAKKSIKDNIVQSPFSFFFVLLAMKITYVAVIAVTAISATAVPAAAITNMKK